MFQQFLTPVNGSLPLSFIVAALPIVTILVLLGVLRRPAWQASLAGLLAGIVVAVGVWHFPIALTARAMTSGAAFAAWPIMWIVFNALLLYNLAVVSGSFESFRSWIIKHLPNDRRIVLVVIGFSFSALLEGVAGFGTPVAITSSLLILLGFAPLDALVCTLIFNTAPVAFAALGVPVVTLANVTHLPAPILAAMIGRQLPFFAVLLPFYVITVHAGVRALRQVWPVLLVAGGSFGFLQFLASNFMNYSLTDVVASLGSILSTLLFLRMWQPLHDVRFAVTGMKDGAVSASPKSTWHAWAPWSIVSATVIVWSLFGVAKIGQIGIPWPGLHNAVSITLYGGTPYSDVWNFQPLGTGTAILVAAIASAAFLGVRPVQFVKCIIDTWRQTRFAILTVMLMIALAYVLNYSGVNYTLGFGISSLGLAFVLLAPFLGWIAVLLTGSDTSGNALFGNLQVVAAKQLQLDPVLFAATNSSGGVMGKMVSPQNIATGLALTSQDAKGGQVFARTFPHSVALTFVLGALVAIQQFVLPWVVPH